MGHIHMVIDDGTDHVSDRVDRMVVQEMRTFRVLRPIFKNGTRHEAGSVIQLEAKTGQRFVDAGDVTEDNSANDPCQQS